MRRRQHLFVLFLLLLLPVATFADNILKGKITDSHGQPLAGAIVEITDLKTGAASDTDGTYQIAHLPKGKFVVSVHLLSYITVTQAINIDGPTQQNFTLNESVIEKNEVVITGSSIATEERRNITPIQSISLKEMHENASSNVIDAIASLPGVSALTTGPSVSKPVIRGLGYNRIITLNDGVRQEGQQWGDEHGIEIDDYNVTRVEVLKGPASLAYGSDALAGVVNIISNPDIPANKITGNITANYQTNAGMYAIHGDVGGNQNGISWQVYGTQKNAHDYQNKYDGYVFDTRFHNTDYGASVGINKSWGSSRLSYTSFNEKTGIPEGDRDSATGKLVKDAIVNGAVVQQLPTEADNKSYVMTTPYQHIYHQKLVWDNNIYLGNGGRLSLTLAYQRNERMEFPDIETPNTPGLSLLLQTATYDFKYVLPTVNNWQISTGINGMQQWNENKGIEFLVPDYRLLDGGVYGMAKREWAKWAVAGGLRIDTRTINADQKTETISYNGTTIQDVLFHQFTTSYTNVSGSIGTSYNASKSTILKLNLSSGFRAPNIAELSANGVHDGTVRYETGNLALKPEKSFQADFGISWSSEHVLINASIFDNFIKDFIYIRKLVSVSGTDSIPQFNDPNNYAAYVYTQADANLYGGELYIDLHPHPFDWLHFENTLSYVRGNLLTAVDGTNNLPYMPPARWLTELRAQKRTLGKYLKSAYVKVGLDVNAAQNNVFTAYNTETATPGYSLLDAGIGADVTNSQHHTICTITLAAQNITDVAYQNALSRLRYTSENLVTGRPGIYNMGRNFSIICSVPLDLK